MVGSISRPLFVAALCCAAALPFPSSAGAQAIPSPAQAQELLRARPELIDRLRQEIGTSGMSPEQIRARLRAAGYPESLLDAYMPGGMVRDSLLSPQVFSAVQELGIADAENVDAMRAAARREAAMFRQRSDTVYDVRSARALEERREEELLDERRRLLQLQERAARDTGLALREQLPDTDLPPRERMLADSGFVIFGADVFRRASTEFVPDIAGAVDPSYRLGPGDRLVLILTGDVELSHSLQVNREGFVVVPQVGQLHVANLTLGQLEDLLYSRLSRAYSGISRSPNAPTRFSISVSGLRTSQVFVTGDVQEPGSYRISSAGTAMTALYAAGGPTANGSLRQVEVRRGGQLIGRLDVYDYLLRGDASQDLRLQSGDVVFVPVHGPRVRVVGEVVRPATYELRAGETLHDLLRAAGGLTARASPRRVQIERILPAAERGSGRERVVMEVAANNGAATAEVPPVPVESGDVVRVFPVSERVRNRIVVQGNVWAPGAQGLEPGMRVSDALRLAGGTKPDTYLGQILISRLQDDSTRVQLRALLADRNGTVVNDFALQEDDEIRVFSTTEFRPTRYVAVSGAVRRGGQYPYREGMTVRDLVLMAGGLREGAYLREAEIARLPESRAGGITAQTFRVPLDSTYIFERSLYANGNGESQSLPPGLPGPANAAPEVVLRPYDNVLILQQPDWEMQRTVILTGEVQFPGRYALTSKNERVSDVIVRAGGLTTEAYPAGVTFHRTRDELGRIGIDLPEALRNGRHRDNLLLVDGDSIHIPVYSSVVYVSGAVNSPVAVAYVPGRDLSYYISAAGGASRRADVRRAYVTQPNGKVESAPSRFFADTRSPRPLPGSRIVVPERDPDERREFLASATTIVQILASLVTVVAVLRR